MNAILLLVAAAFSQPEPVDKGIVRSCQCECCVARAEAAKRAMRKAKESTDLLREFGYSSIAGRVVD